MIEMLKQRFEKSIKTCLKCMIGRFLVLGFIIFLGIDLLTR